MHTTRFILTTGATAALLLSLSACGDDDGGGDGGGDDDGGMCLPLGAACTATGTPCCPPNGCAGGTCGAPRVDGGPASMCPTTPPADMESCLAEGEACTWLRCTAEGEVRAACASGSWDVSSMACAMRDCEGELCPGDQLCVQRIGGAFLVECGENPCGDGPITAACACSICGSFPCTVIGTTVMCNTCPSGKCP